MRSGHDFGLGDFSAEEMLKEEVSCEQSPMLPTAGGKNISFTQRQQVGLVFVFHFLSYKFKNRINLIRLFKKIR